jgi:hypothetical protein
MDSAPNILIMDNDETTGSYYVLFFIYDFLAKSGIGNELDSLITINQFYKYFKEFNVFRPNLEYFLKTMNQMKTDGSLDRVCIYTNQLDVRYIDNYSKWVASDGKVWSPPEILRIMYNKLAHNKKFIDGMFTRPFMASNNVYNNYPVKDLAKVFRHFYPNQPVRLDKTIFIDDRYQEHYIINTSNSGTDKLSRYPMSPYYRSLPENAFDIILNAILKRNNISLEKYPDAVKLRQKIQQEWSEKNKEIKQLELDNPIKSDLLNTLAKDFKQFYLSKGLTNSITKNIKNARVRAEPNVNQRIREKRLKESITKSITKRNRGEKERNKTNKGGKGNKGEQREKRERNQIKRRTTKRRY